MLFQLANIRSGNIEDVRIKDASLEGPIWIDALASLRRGQAYSLPLPDGSHVSVALDPPVFIREMFGDAVELPQRFLTVYVKDGGQGQVPVVLGGLFYEHTKDDEDVTVLTILYSLSLAGKRVETSSEAGKRIHEEQERIFNMRPACICVPSFRPTNNVGFDESEENLIFTCTEMAACLASALFYESLPRVNQTPCARLKQLFSYCVNALRRITRTINNPLRYGTTDCTTSTGFTQQSIFLILHRNRLMDNSGQPPQPSKSVYKN